MRTRIPPSRSPQAQHARVPLLGVLAQRPLLVAFAAQRPRGARVAREHERVHARPRVGTLLQLAGQLARQLGEIEPRQRHGDRLRAQALQAHDAVLDRGDLGRDLLPAPFDRDAAARGAQRVQARDQRPHPGDVAQDPAVVRTAASAELERFELTHRAVDVAARRPREPTRVLDTGVV
jgi:hypothetical protein